MFLTDGIIEDLDDTIEALVEGSYYPLSVIIIGIGEGEPISEDNKEGGFSKMIKLDGDEIPLISKHGIKRMRDLVQFVPFKNFNKPEDTKKLAAEVFEEIPRQIIEYYTLNFIYPEMLKDKKYKFDVNKNYNIIKNNFKISNNKINYKDSGFNIIVDDSDKKIYDNKMNVYTPGNENMIYHNQQPKANNNFINNHKINVNDIKNNENNFINKDYIRTYRNPQYNTYQNNFGNNKNNNNNNDNNNNMNKPKTERSPLYFNMHNINKKK